MKKVRTYFFTSLADAIWQTALVAIALAGLTAVAVGVIEEVQWRAQPAVALEGPDRIPVELK